MEEKINEQKTAAGADILKPDEDKKDIEKPKKKHRGRVFLIVLGVIIILIVLAIGLTGIYEIPGVSAIFGMNKPKDLGVTTGPEHLESLKANIPMKIEGATADYSSDSEIFSGEMAVDTQITANEISSWLQRHQTPNPILTNLTVRQYEGGMEISAMANQYIKAPVYAKIDVVLLNPTTVDLNLQQGKIGVFSVPEQYLDEVETALEKQVNHLINTIPGFSIETYELHDGYSIFKGTMPETVKPSAKGWADLMNY